MFALWLFIGIFTCIAVDSAWNIARILWTNRKVRIERERYMQERADFENRAAKR